MQSVDRRVVVCAAQDLFICQNLEDNIVKEAPPPACYFFAYLLVE